MDSRIKEYVIRKIDNLDWFEINIGDYKIDFSKKLKKALNSKLDGLYFIRTNTPINTLKSLKNKNGTSKKTNINQTITRNETSIGIHNLTIPFSVDGYIVYNGKGINILSRVGAHIRNLPNPKTGCLGLGRYKTKLNKNKWEIAFIEENDPAMRTFIEQGFRGHYGWPILCKE